MCSIWRTLFSRDALGALMLLFTSSSAAFRSIMGIMSEIQGRHRYRGFWPTVFSIVYSLIFLAAIYMSLVVIGTGNCHPPGIRAPWSARIDGNI
jgi:uncharacterized BrkB/YihY/UPF0761 family membrane protein